MDGAEEDRTHIMGLRNLNHQQGYNTLQEEGESRLNSKRDLYERGHVAVCSHRQAICITVFVFSSILATSLIVAFARPWNDCGGLVIPALEVEEPHVPMASNGEVFPWDDVRLPIFIRPISYDLELTPNLTTLAVKGIIKLIFQVREETDFIIFHSKNISITSKTINEKLKVQRLLEYEERDQVYLETNQPMKPGKTYSIRLKFLYNLTAGLQGFYLSTYKDKNGNERRLATTHFEPTAARQAFPCFDEPQLKAKFLVTITHDADLKSFFNMPVKETSPVRGKLDQIRTEFEESREMSTYLVAFVICDFDYIENQTSSNITIRVITPPEKLDQATFALEQATLITENYERYFGVPYPLPKQDLIAIPDFGAGAMENWGLITYRETSLLYEEKGSSTKDLQWVAIVIAHELAHQWFGNLVTMRWWNDLWLNEGFASWMEYKGVNETKPEWKMMEQFWGAEIHPALALDALQASHPISVPVKDPKDIEGIFDNISYKKGSSIINMLEHFIGETSLRSGLALYLTRHKFKNAVTNDLWAALSEATNYTKDVERMMKTWTLQMGYPLCTISQVDNTSTWEVHQSRFLLAGQLNGTNSSLPESKFNYTWVVPFDLVTDTGKKHSILLQNQVNKTGGSLKLEDDIKWFKANLDGNGFYRVNYPSQIWEALMQQLKDDHTVFSSSDRAQLLDDAFSLVVAGILPDSIALGMSEYLTKESDLLPWTVAIKNLGSWRMLLRESQAREQLDTFVQGLIGNLYTKLGWQDQGSHVQRLLRSKILETALEAGLEDALETSRSFYKDLKKGENQLSAEFKELVYCHGLKEGTKQDWDMAFKQYSETNIPALRGSILKALTCTRDVYILQDFLDMCFNKTQVRSQDVRTLLGMVSRNPVGTLLSWRHFRAHWDKYYSMFGHGSFTMGSIIHEVTAHFSTPFDLHQVEDFFRDRETGPGQRSLLQSIEKIKVNIGFRERSEESILDWLHQHNPSN